MQIQGLEDDQSFMGELLRVVREEMEALERLNEGLRRQFAELCQAIATASSMTASAPSHAPTGSSPPIHPRRRQLSPLSPPFCFASSSSLERSHRTARPGNRLHQNRPCTAKPRTVVDLALRSGRRGHASHDNRSRIPRPATTTSEISRTSRRRRFSALEIEL
jgi:hypothetical protein